MKILQSSKNILRLATLAVFLSCVATAFSTPPGGVYIKNSGQAIMHLWVNGSYQGYIKPGETRYSVSDGFHEDGNANSHGGWENDNSGQARLTVQYPGDKPQTWSSTGDKNGNVVSGVNESTQNADPPIPTEEERENAPQIIKGNDPNSSKRSRYGPQDPIDPPPPVDPPPVDSSKRSKGTYRGGIGVNVTNYWTDVTIDSDGTITEANYESLHEVGSDDTASAPRIYKHHGEWDGDSRLTYQVVNNEGRTFTKVITFSGSTITYDDEVYKKIR